MGKIIEGDLVYAATPFRMIDKVEEICDFIEKQGYFPVHPLLALPIDRYNYERHSRENIYRVCFGLIDISKQLWIFGIGSGSFKEYLRAKESGKPTKSFVKMFDKDWEEWSKKERYQTNYFNVINEVLSQSKK